MTRSAPETGISLKVTKTIKASRERVFAAWTQPEMLHQWWGAHESFSAPIAEVDLKVGGKYRFGMLEPGKDAPYVSYGTYREVTPPEKLVFTWAFEKMPGDDADFVPAETLVTVEFIDKDGATEVVLTHERFPDDHMRDEHQAGWDGCLDGLERFFASGS
ncbi:MAG: SRPBCC domain-containing protein [Chloroflexi bacterium]|nr:SRPBCC domain-containing protein [Chloroflexota bacterium]